MLIAFVGSVFSPFYARARKQGAGVDPLKFPAMNVVLYGPGRKKLWVMTEGRADRLERSPDSYTLGGTTLTWSEGRLHVRFEEKAAPFGQRMAGTITLDPGVIFGPEVHLDANGRHRWWPIAPNARAEVQLDQPSVRFSGAAYHDSNQGSEPLERGFVRWDWSRAEIPGQGAVVFYDADRRDGSTLRWAHRFTPEGEMIPVDPEARWPVAALKTGGWGVKRAARHPEGAPAKLIRSLEDTPFYCRSLVANTWAGSPVKAVHESLDLDRFDRGWVRFLLPFRMRRERS